MTENGQVVKVKDVSCTILIKGIFSIVPLFQVLANAQSSEPNQSLLQESCFNEVVMLYFYQLFHSFCVSFCLSMHTSVFCIFKQGEHEARDKDGAECKQDLPQAERPHLGEEHVAGAGGKIQISTLSSSLVNHVPLFQGGQDENYQRASLLSSQHSRREALWDHR